MSKFLVAIVFVASTLAVPASAQVLIETGALSSPKKPKDLGDIWDRAMKEPGAKPAKPAAKPAAKPVSTRAVAAPAKPTVLPETFSGNTEDAMSILDINADALTHFSAAIDAEVARRSNGTGLTKLQYDSVGAAAGGFTARQYWVFKARIRPFCEAIAAGQAPSDNLVLAYMPSEAAAIRPRCATLLPVLKLTPVIPLGK
ncbi:MAG TPA: hypothetical protein VIU65_03345 [Pyrinomonadaceae bacterium]